MMTRDRLFVCHLVVSMLTFMLLLSSTVSDYWSTTKYGFHGLFKECNLITACSSTRQSSVLYRGIQFLQITSCISVMCGVVYCFISLLLRQYLQNKVYLMAIFYSCSVVCVVTVTSLYFVIIHQGLKDKQLEIGWAFYTYAVSGCTSLLGFTFSFPLYQREKREAMSALVVIDEKEMKYHQRSINLTK